jgi:hypothetical protein
LPKNVNSPASAASPRIAPSLGRAWPYAIVSLFWVLLIFIYAVQMIAMDRLSWQQAFGRAASDWLPWVALSPAMFWLAGRVSIGPGRIIWPVTVSLVVCVGAMFAAEWGFQQLRPVLTTDRFPTAPWFGPGAAASGAVGRPLRDGPGYQDQGPPDRPGQPGGYPGWTDAGPPGGPGGRGGPEGRGPAGRPLGRPGGAGQGPMQHMMHFHLPISLFVIMASNAYAYFLQMRDRERKASELARSLAEARLSALQMQLHPHFLFNALNATTALIRRDPAAAEEMIANLSELLRLALSVRDRHEVTVRQELDYLECYLAIERVRFGDRLRIHWNVDETAKQGRVPVLLLQPIVENAIRHGVERRNVDIGEVWITAEHSNGRLHFSVRDNGPGPQATSTRRGHGVGLDNTRARLAALHGADADVRIATGAGGGCVVTIELPFQTQPQNQPHEDQGAHR